MVKTKSAKFVAIIPARGGSKRFPKKNIHELHGQPLISYPIKAAKNAELVDRVIVSTDDGEIAEIAKQFGAEVPFLRPDHLATDQSPTINTVRHAITELKKKNYDFDYIVLIQPTSPLIEVIDINNAIDLVIKNNADSVVAVAPVNNLNHPHNIRKIKKNGIIKFWRSRLHYQFIHKPKEKPKFYHAGGLWISKVDVVMKENRLEGKRNYPLVISKLAALDIDYEEDLKLIESWFKNKNLNN